MRCYNPYLECEKPTVCTTDTYSTEELLCKVLKDNTETKEQVEDIQETVDQFDERITENSDNISENKEEIKKVDTKSEANKDQIMYLVSQFSDGQTGLIIDGGFFEETGIKRNYNGGVF